MLKANRLFAVSILILSLLGSSIAQGEQPGKTSAATVTVAANTGHVRFTAPSNVVRTDLQVISDTGQVVFEISSKGNVLDWTLQDSSGQRLQGAYLTLVTVKSLSGRLSERVGTVSISGEQVELKAFESIGLTPAQQQTIGPIEEKASLTILDRSKTLALTALAHNGIDGQLTSTTGALTLRTGDFFSGKEVERVRVTETSSSWAEYGV